MKSWKLFKKELLNDDKTRAEFEKLKPRYQVISQLIEKRIKQGITQAELARRIGTKQSAIARIESGNSNPTISFLEKVTRALDSQIVIQIK